MTRAVDIEGRGVRVNGRSVGVGSAIPDSVVSRPDDDGAGSVDDRRGLEFVPTSDFGSMGYRLSQNTSGVTRAYVYDLSNDSVIAEKDISGLSSLDAFTIDADYVGGQSYGIVCDAEGSTYSSGKYTAGDSFPYKSSDVDITGALFNTTNSASQSKVILEIGDVGFS